MLVKTFKNNYHQLTHFFFSIYYFQGTCAKHFTTRNTPRKMIKISLHVVSRCHAPGISVGSVVLILTRNFLRQIPFLVLNSIVQKVLKTSSISVTCLAANPDPTSLEILRVSKDSAWWEPPLCLAKMLREWPWGLAQCTGEISEI